MLLDKCGIGLLGVFCQIYFAILLKPEIQIVADADIGWGENLTGIIILRNGFGQSRFSLLLGTKTTFFNFLSLTANLGGIEII